MKALREGMEPERFLIHVALQHDPDTSVDFENEVGSIYLLITQQLSETPPERPEGADFYWGSPRWWYPSDSVSKIIDGKKGYLVSYDFNDGYDIHPSLRDTQYICRYDMNTSTFVTISQQKGNFDKDMALVLDTLHINYRSDR